MKRKNGIISGIFAVFILAVTIFLISCQGVMPYCTVTFKNGEETVSVSTVLSGGTVKLPDVELEAGYGAVWLLPDGTEFSPSSTVSANVTLTLSPRPINYRVVYELGGGVAPEGNPDAFTVESEPFTLLSPTRAGAVFEGWTDEAGNTVMTVDSSCIGLADEENTVTLTAKWRVTTFGVTYDPAGGSLPDNPDTYTVDDTDTVLLPSQLRGYTFLGWFTPSGDRVESFVGCVGELSLTARWEITRFKIVYDAGKGTDNALNPTSFTFLDTVTVSAPTRYGYNFIGWVTDEADEPVEEYVIDVDTVTDVHLTAVWEAHAATLTVMNGETQYAKINTEFGEVFTLYDIAEKRDGYALTVYTDPEHSKVLTLPYEICSYAATVYVFYTPIEYSVKLDYGDGIFESFRTYTVESEGFSLPSPEREGFTFKGWSDGSGVYDSVPHGSFGNKKLTAVWERNYYTLSFDTVEGSEIAPIQIEYGAKIVFNVTTRRDGMVFGGWYEDAEYEKEFVGGTMPARAITLYARWFLNASYTVTYYSDPAGVDLVGSCNPGAQIMDGNTVTFSAPEYENGKLFIEWIVNGVSFGKERDISVLLDGGPVEAVACYRSVRGFDFDLSADASVSIPTFASSACLDGYGIMNADQSLGGGALTVNGDFLRSLGTGLKVFAMTENGSVSFVYINITDSAPRPTVKVDFDSAFPNVILSCDIPAGQSYVYRVNGGLPKSFEGSVVLTNIDRSRDNTFTVSPVGGGESYQKTVKAINIRYAEFYNGSFTYGGRTYDLVINSAEELRALIEYVCFVLVETDAVTDTTGKAKYSVDLSFIIGDDYAAEFNADKASAYARIFDSLSIPYSPAYTTSAFGDTSPKGKVTLYFNELNTVSSSQDKNVLEDKYGVLDGSDRPANFEGFYIDYLDRTQLVRSLYELESLPFGVRPTFDSSAASQRAKAVYEKARAVLAKHVSDGMTAYEKAAAIYAYLGLNVTYDKTLASNMGADSGKYRSFTSYGALIDGVAVCDGYASAYRIMCLIEGIQCVEVIGTSNGVGHAWNKVFIDGLWYGVDSTWSRVANESLTLRYLLINEAQLIEGGHVENDCGNGNETYITFIASDGKDHYDISGRAIKDASDIKRLVNAAAAEGVTVLELKNASGKTLEQLFSGYGITDFNVKSLSYNDEKNSDIVYIYLELE